MAANIALALIFIQFLGVAGIALATGLVGWLQLGLLARALKGHEAMQLDARFRSVLPKILLASAIMGACVYGGQRVLWPFLMDGGVVKYLALAGIVAGGIIAYGLAVQVTGAFKFSDLRRYLSKGNI